MIVPVPVSVMVPVPVFVEFAGFMVALLPVVVPVPAILTFLFMFVPVVVNSAAMPVDINRSPHGEGEGAAEGTSLQVKDVGAVLQLAVLMKEIAEPDPGGGSGDQEGDLDGVKGGLIHEMISCGAGRYGRAGWRKSRSRGSRR